MKQRIWMASAALAGLYAALPEVALACEKCFGVGSDSATAEGISMAMLAMLAMIGVIWGGFGAFFIHMRKRARLLEPGDLIVTEYGDIRPRPPALDTPSH